MLIVLLSIGCAIKLFVYEKHDSLILLNLQPVNKINCIIQSIYFALYHLFNHKFDQVRRDTLAVNKENGMERKQTDTKPEFDQFADNYDTLLKKSITASGFEPAYFDEHKIRTLFNDYKAGNKTSDAGIKILNFGCGVGKSEEYINKYFTGSFIYSVDVSEKSIAIARERNETFSNVEFKQFNKVEELHFDEKFDIIFVANVFHHIPEELHLTTLYHLRSMLSAKGFLYVFEHNPLNPLTRKVFETCEFDVGCKMIKSSAFVRMCENTGYTAIKKKYVLFFPKSVSFLSGLEKFLGWCPLGAQYYIKAR